jgi:ABC-type branched-subunit amino acid transport system substrate-binding protein
LKENEMFRRHFAWRSVAVLGVAALTLAACADDGDDGGDDPGDDAAACTEGDGLHIGTILPQTGNLAFLGPPEFAGVDVAAQEINEAGGIDGTCVRVTDTDSGDQTTDLASQSADRLIQDNVHAVIGAASSGVSFTFIDRLYEEQIVQVSPANTSPDFSTYENEEFYFRTAPSDVLQGRVLGDVVVADGHASVGMFALNDAYGRGLAEYTTAAIEEAGGEVIESITYDPGAPEFSAEVQQMVDANPDAIVLITFEEFTQLAPELANAGLDPQTVQWYLVDGNLSNYGDEFDEGFLEGAKGTLPGTDPEPIRDRLLEADPALEDFSYGPESYDATILVALAAAQAGNLEGQAIRDAMQPVSNAPGTPCGPGADSNTTFADCLELVTNGEDIDYEGFSGPVNWNEVGDITAGTIGVYQYGPDNNYTNLEYRPGELE